MWVLFALAEEATQRKGGKPEVAQAQVRMLAREDERRRKPALGERMRDWCKLDGFGPGADDQANTRGPQPSP